jgi:hypothetical protein
MFENFNDFLFDYILEDRDDFKTVKEVFESGGEGTVKKDLPELSRLEQIHNGIENFYRTVNDGYGIEWWENEERGIGGKFNFTQTKYLFAENNVIYDEGDSQDLKYFRPLDYPTPESYVGFIITPDTIDESLYYMSISDYELNDLDLDYEGYTQMAVEARVFNHWQRVLL